MTADMAITMRITNATRIATVLEMARATEMTDLRMKMAQVELLAKPLKR